MYKNVGCNWEDQLDLMKFKSVLILKIDLRVNFENVENSNDLFCVEAGRIQVHKMFTLSIISSPS